MITGCERDVDAAADVDLVPVVSNLCHFLDRQLFEDEFVIIDPGLGRPCILLRDLLYKILELDP